MNGKSIAYWATTGLLSAAMFASAGAYLSGAMNEDLHHLGYPQHFIMVLGAWKLLVPFGLLLPGPVVLKHWTYAGLFFTFTGAMIAHQAAGDGLAHIAPPLFMLVLWSVSYALQAEVRGTQPQPLGSPGRA